eukprot:4400094-Prymnesium_polylepis.1
MGADEGGEVEEADAAAARALAALRSGDGRGGPLSAEAGALLGALSPRAQGALWAVAWLPAGGCEPEYARCLDAARQLRSTLDYDWDEAYRKQHGRLCSDLDVIGEDVPRTYLEESVPYCRATPDELTAVLEAHVMAEGLLEDQGMGY